tara:strand:+ start:248 stop:475 length:228 start_codon:yes stop_codon:yes gene_type:complete
MYQEFTAKDILKKAREMAVSQSLKTHDRGFQFKYIDHVLVVDNDDCGCSVAIKVKLERTRKGSPKKDMYYEHQYL